MNIIDVMIHINENTSEDNRCALIESMRKIDGVISPGFNTGKEHLLIVAFNPEKTSQAVLLEKTRSAGYTAQLVGA